MAENEDQVNEPEETPAQETPAADVPETPEAAATPEEPTAEEVVVEGDAVVTDEDLEYVEDEEDATPRVKPAIPGMDPAALLGVSEDTIDYPDPAGERA